MHKVTEILPGKIKEANAVHSKKKERNAPQEKLCINSTTEDMQDTPACT